MLIPLAKIGIDFVLRIRDTHELWMEDRSACSVMRMIGWGY